MLGQTRLQFRVHDVVSEVSEIGTLGFDLIDLLKGLIHGEVSRMVLEPQGINHEDIEITQ